MANAGALDIDREHRDTRHVRAFRAEVEDLLFLLAWACGVVGLILGLVGRGRVKRGEANNEKMTWAWISLSLIAITLGILGVAVVNDAFEDVEDDLEGTALVVDLAA